MKHKVIALLDYPHSASAGITPFVIKGDHGYRICGFEGGHRYLSPDSLATGVFIGTVLSVDGPEIQFEENEDLSAGWIGNDFEIWRVALNAPAFELAKETPYPVENGKYWIAKSITALDILNKWILAAAPLAISNKSPALAKLMEQVSPAHWVTRATLYMTQPTEEAKLEELQWIARLERDAGRPISEDDLKSFLVQYAREIMK